MSRDASQPSGGPSSSTFVTRLPTRWGDQDAYGHVNNARYFTYFEQARVDWLGARLDGWDQAEALPTVVHQACDYKRPVVHPATLVIEVAIEPPGNTSLVTRYTVRTEGEDGAPGPVCATGTVTLVWVRRASGRPVRIPDDVRGVLGAS
jgi:acyl-CoA thioester hydrolase